MSCCGNCKFNEWCQDKAEDIKWCIRKSHLNIAYKQGRADQKEEDNAFFNFEGAWELEKKKVRADAIDECIEMLNGIDKQVANLVKEFFDLKEQ